MPPSRACHECRSAKARCDLVAPVCGRCTVRGFACSGATQGNLLFLNENAVAQRNSWLARRPRRGVQRQSPTSASESPQSANEMTEHDFQKLYYWLNNTSLAEVSQPLLRDLETRAVERFFLDWTLSPSNDGLTPGYMYDLPSLYATAQPGSVLWNAVRAVAFADLRDYNVGSFALKARQSYGAALMRMRVITEDNRKLIRDRILAALLLIDVFELIYLSRREPLGPHKEALKHILFLRGEEQFQNRTRFELWRAAQQRLQAQRMTQKDDPHDEQLSWISKLNASLPDLHVCVDVEKMVVLCSAGRRTAGVSGGITPPAGQAAKQAEELLQNMRKLATVMENWGAQVAIGWRPQRLGAAEQQDFAGKVVRVSISQSPVLEYSDPWLAYKWNFHAAAQIILRETMVEMTEHLSHIQSLEKAYEARQAAEIEAARAATPKLASTIIESCIPLLGFSKLSTASPRGKMARRFFAVCAMWVVQNARFARHEQKQTATEVLEWIDRVHRLG